MIAQVYCPMLNYHFLTCYVEDELIQICSKHVHYNENYYYTALFTEYGINK